MTADLSLRVLPPKPGCGLGDVYVYLPTGDGRFTEVRFAYTHFAPMPSLSFSARRLLVSSMYQSQKISQVKS